MAGLAILLACTATVRPHDVGTLETDVFRLANDLPGALFPAFLVVMKAGNVLAVGVVAATRRFWLAANRAITGIGVWLLAKAIKVRVVLAGPYGNGSGLLVQRMIPGHSLEELEPAAVDDATLDAAWEEVARLHQAGIAHGDLGRHSVLVDEDRPPWLVDLDHATAVAPERLRQADLVELLVSLAVRFGPDRAWPVPSTPSAPSPWPPPWPPPPPPALTHMTREELGEDRGLWDELARRVATPTTSRPEEQPQPDAALRRRSSDPSR